MLTSQELSDFIYGDNGLLTKYHFGDGLDEKLVDQFYVYLEEYRYAWHGKPDIPRDIVSHLVSVAVGLRHYLFQYENNPDLHYAPIVETISTAIEVMLQPEDDLSRGKLRDFIKIDF